MELLELSVELVEIVVEKMIAAIGVLKALKLRLVCKLFDKLVMNDLLDASRSRQRATSILRRRPFFVKFLKRELESDASKTSHLSSVLNQCIDKMLYLQPTHLGGVGGQRPMLMSNLIESVAAGLSIHMAIEYLEPQCPNHELASEDVLLHGAMVLAASTDDIETMEALIREAGGFPPHSEYFGRIFTAAARTGAYNIAVYLLEHGYDHNKDTKRDWTRRRRDERIISVSAAAYRGQKEIINLMFECDLISKSEGLVERYGREAISAAFRGGHFALVTHIWKVLFHESRDWGRCVLYFAASSGALSIVQELVDTGVDPGELAPGVGGSAIQGAASHGRVEVVAYLLHVLGGESKSDHGKLLTLAAWHNQANVVELLLDEGADVNVSVQLWSRTRTPLMAAAERYSEDTVEILLERGANISLIDGPRCLWFAYKFGLYRFARMLIQAGIDPNVQGEGSWCDWSHGVKIPPIIRASVFQQHEIVQLLLDLGVVLPDLSANSAYQAYADSIKKYQIPRGRMSCIDRRRKDHIERKLLK